MVFLDVMIGRWLWLYFVFAGFGVVFDGGSCVIRTFGLACRLCWFIAFYLVAYDWFGGLGLLPVGWGFWLRFAAACVLFGGYCCLLSYLAWYALVGVLRAC